MTSQAEIASQNKTSPAWACPALAIVGAALGSLFLYGYSFGLVNHGIQIPYLRWLQDSSLYPGDPFMQSMQNYFSYFWPIMAGVTRFLPLEPVFFFGHLTTLLLFYLAIFMLARSIFPARPAAAYLGLWIILWANPGIGGESLHWNYLAHTPVATVMCLFSLMLAVRGQWVAAYALAGLAFNIHSMQSAYVLTMLTFAYLFEEKDATFFKKLILCGGVYGLCMLPGLYWIGSSGALGSPEELPTMLGLIFPRHFFAAALSGRDWVELGGLLILFLFCCRRLSSNPSSDRARRMACAIVLFLVVAGSTIAIHPFAILLKLHVFRSCAFLGYLVLILLGGTIIQGWPGVSHWAFGDNKRLANACGLFALACFGSLTLVDWIAVRYVAAVALCGVGFLGLLIKPKHSALGYVLLVGLSLSMIRFAEDRERWEPFHPWKESWAKENAWFEVQEWVRDNSAPDDLILTPPDKEGFRVFSERAIVGEWKDGSAVMWDKDFAPQWIGWYEAVGGNMDDETRQQIDARLAEVWMNHSTEFILNLAVRRRADWIVLRKRTDIEKGLGFTLEWAGEVDFENSGYLAFRVK